MAPVLFSLYFAVVVDDWRDKCSVVLLGQSLGISMAAS